MRPEFGQIEQINWVPLEKAEFAKFKSQIAAALDWVLKTLDETERSRRLPRTNFDQPIRERVRRAS